MNNTSFSETLKGLLLPNNFSTAVGGIKLPTKPSFGKLSKHRFSRVNPDPAYQMPILVVEDKESGDTYLAAPHIAPYLGNMAHPKVLRLAVDSVGTLRIVAAPIIDPTAKSTLWTVTMLHAIQLAEDEWIRIESNMPAGQYSIIKAASDLGEPAWPDLTMSELVEEVFLGKIILDTDHPLVLQLQGRI